MRVVELFAGVGGFRLGLERAGGHQIVWSNQWEPSVKAQHAFDAYTRHFGADHAVNADIATVPAEDVPPHDLLVGGFPCQDYSVQTTLDKSQGLRGRKGVLWWEIHRLVEHHRPPHLLLENVDRLLRSPATQRGRDFGVMLRCLADLGYRVEWRVLNAADHGFPQRRRRTFIVAAHEATAMGARMAAGAADPSWLRRDGFFAGPFPVMQPMGKPMGLFDFDEDLRPGPSAPDVTLPEDPKALSDAFSFDFCNAGVMVGGRVWTRRVDPVPQPAAVLGDVLEGSAPEAYLLPEDRLADWRYQKGAKDEPRTAKNGHVYRYKEGPVAFPDPLDRPSRTVLTGEGNRSPNRTTHVVQDPATGRLRRLTPLECERLNGFPDGWTEGMPERWRYFTMGNALVVGLVERMARRLQAWTRETPAARPPHLAVH